MSNLSRQTENEKNEVSMKFRRSFDFYHDIDFYYDERKVQCGMKLPACDVREQKVSRSVDFFILSSNNFVKFSYGLV